MDKILYGLGVAALGMITVFAGLIILIRRRHEIRRYIDENKVDNHAVACFFTSPGVIIAFAVLMYTMVNNFIRMQ